MIFWVLLSHELTSSFDAQTTISARQRRTHWRYNQSTERTRKGLALNSLTNGELGNLAE